MRTFYETLQWIVVLVLWSPFKILAWLGFRLDWLATRLGSTLVRPIYWHIVQAERRHYQEPLWQDHDWNIGIGPPCTDCGQNVPPGVHAKTCRSSATLSDFLKDSLNGLASGMAYRAGQKLASDMAKDRDTRACPKCTAPVGQFCKTEDGKNTIHKERRS